MKVFWFLLSIVIILQLQYASAQRKESYKLPPLPSYIILAPKRIRPGQLYQTSVTILKLLYETLTIRMSIKRNDYEYIHETTTFKSEGTQIMRLEIPTRVAPPDDYYLEVVGSITDNSAIIFSNRTRLEFMEKEFSVFIQTSKPVYHQGQTVQFRVIPLYPNLMPVFGTISSIQALDPNGFTIKRWMNPTTSVGGIYEMQFPLADQVTEGNWTIEVELEKWKSRKSFLVKEFWLPRFDVNITLPVRMSEQGFGVYGIIQANKTSGMFVRGNASITLQIREPSLDRFNSAPLIQINRTIQYFEGKADFLFTIDELKSTINQGSLANKDVWVNATVFDSFTLLTRSGWAYSFIYSDYPVIKFLGGLVRPFKPNMIFTAYITVSQPDGTKTVTTTNRNVQLRVYCIDSELVDTFSNIIVPDSGIIKLAFIPTKSTTCPTYRLRAEYMEDGNRLISETEQRLFKYQSQAGAYMQITLETEYPTVNEYAVFHIEMTYPTNKIFIQVVAGGNIVYVDTIVLQSAVKSRTFSLAVSRDMAPVARLVAYYVKTDGEVVADSLTFFANITNLNNVYVGVNRGKDLNMDTVEINGYGEPGSFLALNVLHYDLYSHGADNIIRDYDILEEMMTYEKNYQQPFQKDWSYDLEYITRAYLPSPSFGADSNTTMNSSGLIIFSDANFTAINFYHTCNETVDKSQALPCFSKKGKQCYSRADRCDGTNQCINWADELGCPTIVTNPTPKPKHYMSHFNMLYRHWNDGAWLWKTYWIKPNGRINFRVDLPKIDTSWVIGAYTIDRAKGFSIIQRPAIFSGIRRFYMVVEVPEECQYGEQIGVRITLFNYWDYWTEALLEVKQSDQYRVVQVAEYGITRAFDPETISNKSVHTLVYLNAGESKFLFFPIVLNWKGNHNTNATISICAYTFIGSNCENREIRISMNGVTNYYHTNNLVDLTSKAQLSAYNLKIQLRQSFYEPEERMLRWVPDSKIAKVSIVGDIVGPTPSHKLQFIDTYKGLRMSHGAAENVFFEFGYNVYLLKYIRRDKTTSTNITIRTLDYCNKILQDCLSYYDATSGGFANFRESRNKPNTLATAFALWNLLAVDEADWDRFIYIPNNLVSSAINFIFNKQIKDGYFEGSFEPDDILDSKFMPTNISSSLTPDEVTAQKRIPITAMIILSISDKKAVAPNAEIIQKAATFIDRHLIKSLDIFTQIIGTYALSKSGTSIYNGKISSMIAIIMNNSRSDSQAKYFSDSNVSPQYTEQNNAGTLMINPRLEWPNDGYTTACTALAMLLFKEQNIWLENDPNNLETINFLARMRNHISAFTSTFDSMVALRLFYSFSATDRNRELYKIQVDTSMQSRANWREIVNIEFSNYTVGNLSIIPNDFVWGEVTFVTQGTGRVLIQLDVEGRVFDSVRLKNPRNPLAVETPFQSFEINCTTKFSGKNSSILHMDVCGSWLGFNPPNAKPEAGMTVFDVELPTGYVTLNDELRLYVESGSQPLLRYARFWPGKIHFYLTKLPQTKTCVSFRADRYFPVANVSRDHLCSAYEYYEPGRYNRSIYQTVELYSNHICNVFGSYQCPYSPYFNVASSSVEMSFFFVFGLIFLSLMNHFHWFNLNHLFIT